MCVVGIWHSLQFSNFAVFSLRSLDLVVKFKLKSCVHVCGFLFNVLVSHAYGDIDWSLFCDICIYSLFFCL